MRGRPVCLCAHFRILLRILSFVYLPVYLLFLDPLSLLAGLRLNVFVVCPYVVSLMRFFMQLSFTQTFRRCRPSIYTFVSLTISCFVLWPFRPFFVALVLIRRSSRVDKNHTYQLSVLGFKSQGYRVQFSRSFVIKSIALIDQAHVHRAAATTTLFLSFFLFSHFVLTVTALPEWEASPE